jgi:ribosomal protein S18 acetylase RimI-like enzyme
MAGTSSGMVWVRTDKKTLTAYLGKHFGLTPDPEEFFYYSSEYVMPRSKFNQIFDGSLLTVKPYEESHIDSYLSVLADSMSFFMPPQDFFLEKPQYLKDFSELRDKSAFEAFWKNDELVGLYWLDGIEVDTMGVSSNFQRSGYGSAILTRAIEKVFQQNPEADHALLYCVGWNAKAQNFYKKYGMELSKIHKVPYKNVNG